MQDSQTSDPTAAWTKRRSGGCVDGEEERQSLLLDLSFNPEITDELMVVYFDLNKEIFCITMRLQPFELIGQACKTQVRYRYDWHAGAMPIRYTYDKTGQKQPLNELALDLAPGEYGRAVCNGRFRDWDTGYYALDILNVIRPAKPTNSLTSFLDREPDKLYTQIDLLW